MPEDKKLIRTFISYSHDSELLKKQVLVLADKLNEMGGIDCKLDQYEFPAPPVGWPQWMTYQVDRADYIIMVCTKGYFEKFYRKNEPGTGLGGINECFLITNKFHKMSSASNCFIPVFFADGKEEHIPSLFAGHHHYRLEDNEGFNQARFDELYFHITDQAPTPAPAPTVGIKLRPKVSRGEFPQTPTSSSEEEDDQVPSPSPEMFHSVQGNAAKLPNHDSVKPLLPELKSEMETSAPNEKENEFQTTPELKITANRDLKRPPSSKNYGRGHRKMTDTFRWLHLTDLHWGSKDHRFDWANVIDHLCDDLNRLQKEKYLGGPFDAVFFTGDLVYDGEVDDYRKVNETLENLISRINPKGKKPIFLAVPGNHDLVRPDVDDEGVMLLQHYFENENVRKKIWKDKESLGFKTLENAFKNFVDWRDNLPQDKFRKPEKWRVGYMPGEFSATFSSGDLSIGVLGLNTAFLQLAGGDFEGMLAMEKYQLVHACGEAYDQWEKRHHFNILLTHHPPNWLHKSSIQDYEGYIYKPNRFAFHLCGHVHGNDLGLFTVSGTQSINRKLFTTISLFGHKTIGEPNSHLLPLAERPLGYSAGMVKVLDGGKGEVRVWPRRYVKKIGNVYQLERDPVLLLDPDDEGTEVLPISVFAPSKHQEKIESGDSTTETILKEAIEASNPDRTEIQFLVKQGLLELFSDSGFEAFCTEVKRAGLKTNSGKDKFWVDLLLDTQTFQGKMGVWETATKHFLKGQPKPRQAEIKALEKGTGWLSLLAINEDWRPRRPKASTEFARLKIPCSIQCCIEVVYSFALKSYAQLILLPPSKNLSQEEAETLKLDPLRSKAAILIPKTLDMGTEEEAHVNVLKREIFNRSEIDPDYFLSEFDSTEDSHRTRILPSNAKLKAKLRRKSGSDSAEKIYLLHEPCKSEFAELRSRIAKRLAEDIEIPVVEPGEKEPIWVDNLTEDDLAAILEDYFKILKKYSSQG